MSEINWVASLTPAIAGLLIAGASYLYARHLRNAARKLRYPDKDD